MRSFDRVGVTDIGTNSTRLLIADVGKDGSIAECERRTSMTRLGEGVDASGQLSKAAITRVRKVLDANAEVLRRLGVDTEVSRC